MRVPSEPLVEMTIGSYGVPVRFLNVDGLGDPSTPASPTLRMTFWHCGVLDGLKVSTMN